MEETSIDGKRVFVSHGEPSLPSDPSEGSLNDPSMFIPPEFSSILSWFTHSSTAVRANQLNESLAKAFAQRVRIVSAIGHQLYVEGQVRFGAIQRGFQERYFGGRSGGKLACHRNTLAVNHHHPLRSLATFGFADSSAPFFAGAKDASAKTWPQSKAPLRSSRRTKAPHISSHTPSSSHCLSRRQHVLGCGYMSGKSFQRQPVLSTNNMPSNTKRSSLRGRPIKEGSGRCQRISSQSSSEHMRSFIERSMIRPSQKVQEFNSDFCNQF